MPAQIDEAVCIRHWDWSETSQTVSVFGRNLGIIRAVAKGAKREKAPYSGGIDLATRGEILVIVKPAPAMATLTGWDLRETFPALRSDLRAFNAAMLAIDLVHHAITDADPHPGLYDRLVACLRDLETGPEDALLLFQWAVLEETGYRPVLDRDVHTQSPLARASSFAFSPELGGFVRDPGSDDPAAATGRVWRVRAETVDLLRRVADGSARDGPHDPAAVDRASRLLASYLRDILGREPNAMRAWFGDTLAG